MASKGKAIAVKDSTGKRKRKDNDNGGSNKRKNRDVLQFFEDSAAEFDGDDSDDSDDFFNFDDFLNDDYPKVKSEPGKFEEFPFFPKEEELSGDELEKMLAERYRTKSGYVRYAEDDYDSKRSVDKSFLIPSVVEPTIWKVKCKVGREKNTVFCLIQKFVDLKELGNKLQIISAFAVEHIKGFVFVEAEKQSDVAEACNQLADVYFSLVTKVPTNEVGQLLVVRKRYNEVKEGTWARVKNGIYRGDLTQVVAVNNERKRATVKLIPRIDLQALTVKYGGGAILKRTKGSVPAARLISSRDLEEFRPLIQYRRDRDTGKMFEFLDSLMLKDGFLYKKVSFDSLSFWGVNPSEDELQKFIVPCNDESDNVEWLSQLYGEQKKCNEKINKGGGKGEGLSDKGGGKGEGLSNKGGGKGEGSSGSHEQSSFEVHDLVLFGKRDFGMVIGMEKDDSYKILKDGSDGPVIMALGQKDLKYVPQDKKFTALDHRMKTISINDTVRILDGPSKERQGIVKQIYRGIIFLYDENDLDNAYFCTKSQMCEKVKHVDIACHGKDGGPSGFEDVPSSPKSPLSPKKTWQMRENNSEGKDELFSIGQSLRIRIGPLKGYLCRVLAIRYSDVTVKLDSKQKVLTVKRDHLVEVRGKSSASLIGGDPELSSPFKPFDLLGSEGTTNDWLQASGSADGDGWNVGGLSSERTAWPAFPSSGASLQASTSATDLHSSVGNDNKNDDWLSKVAVGNEKAVDDTVGGWGSAGGWGKEKATGSWDTGKCTEEQGGWNDIGSSGASGWCKQKGGGDGWAEPKCFVGPSENSWGKAADGWGNKNNVSESSGWGSSIAAASQSQAKDSENKGSDDPWGKVADKWGNKDSSNRGNEWGNSANKPAGDGWGNKNNVSESSGWGSSIAAASQSQAKDSENKGSDDPWGKVADKWGNKDSSSRGNEWGNSPNKPAGDGWGNKNNVSESSGWGSSIAAASQSQAKDSENKGSDDPWGKVADKWGNKDSSNTGNEWGNSANKPAGDGGNGWGSSSGGWTNSHKDNAEAGGGASGGWKNSGEGGAGDSWSKPGGFGADRISYDKTDGNDGWGQSTNFENDGGFSRGRGPGGRGRGRGRDQFGRGRGRGRSFDRGQSSSLNIDCQDNYSSGSKGWSNQHGSSWGNSSVENVGLTSTWGEGKSWNDNKGDDNKGVDNSNELNKDVGAWSSQNSTPQTGWDGASFGTSRWGQKSLDSGGNDRQDQDNSEDDPWGKLSKKTRNNAGAFQGSWGGGEGKSVGWKKDSIISSSGWAKGGDVSSEGRESWSKPEENNSWGMKNSDNVHGSSWGGGSGGRRGGRGGFRGGRDQSGRGGFRGGRDQSGRGGFRGGRDQFGRGGGGRSGSQGQFSSWKNEGQSANNEGSSWSGDGGGGQDSGWKKPAEGASAWGAGSKGGWSSSRYMEATSWKKPTEGCSSWGGGGGADDKSSGGGNDSFSRGGWSSGRGGGEDKGWKRPSEGGSSWGGGTDSKGGWSTGGSEDKDWKRPSEGDSTSGGWSTGGAGGGEDKGGWKKPSEGGSSSGGWITGGAGVGEDKGGWKKPSESGSSSGGWSTGGAGGGEDKGGWKKPSDGGSWRVDTNGATKDEKTGGSGGSNNQKCGWLGNDASNNGLDSVVNESSRTGKWAAGNSQSDRSSDAGGSWGN